MVTTCGPHSARCGRNRAFAGVSIVTLGLGIGAATAIFSVIYNVLLAPFPETGADRMVFARIQNVQQGQPGGRQAYTAPEMLEFAEHSQSFDGLVAATGQGGAVQGEGGTRADSRARWSRPARSSSSACQRSMAV